LVPPVGIFSGSWEHAGKFTGFPGGEKFSKPGRFPVTLRAMEKMPVITRFAPSPTGYVHVGNVRTAFFNQLLAEHAGGRFILRSEDTDQERSKPEYLEALIEDLHWLGLRWDEGPDCGGPHGPYSQSERGELYSQYYDRLLESADAYPCYCSDRELKLSRKLQLSAGRPPRYSGTCRELSAQERAEREAQGRLPVLRFRVCAGEPVVFEDLVRGSQSFAREDIGDFVIRRADGSAAFFFGNAIDDSLMQVTHVLRGEDHVANTPRQILLLQALGLRTPVYGHFSLMVGDDGAPLSKRHGASSLRELRQAGYLPGAILNHFLRLGHKAANDDWLELDQMAAQFHTDALGRAPARYDMDQLGHWQKEALMRLSAHELASWLDSEDRGRVPRDQLDAFLELVKPNLMFPVDMKVWVEVMFGELPVPQDAEQEWLDNAGAEFFAAASKAAGGGTPSVKAITDAVKAATGAKGKQLFMPLRVALTGRTDGPGLQDIVSLMNPATIEKRLKKLAVGQAES
jgi:nondiscriminating glutamyl-tRNA synthetase